MKKGSTFVDVSGAPDVLVQRLLNVLANRPKEFVVVTVSDPDPQLNAAVGCRAPAGPSSWRPSIQPVGVEKFGKKVDGDDLLELLLDAGSGGFAVPGGAEATEVRTTPRQGRRREKEKYKQHVQVRLPTPRQCSRGEKVQQHVQNKNQNLHEELWEPAVRRRGRRGNAQNAARWQAADEARKLRAEEWDKQERSRLSRDRAARRVQAAFRKWLRVRACSQTSAPPFAEFDGKWPEHTTESVPPGQTDDELIEQAIAMANDEREQILADAGKLQRLHMKATGAKYLDALALQEFRCHQCDEHTYDVAFSFCRENQDSEQWCSDCVRLDVEIRLRHPIPTAGKGGSKGKSVGDSSGDVCGPAAVHAGDAMQKIDEAGEPYTVEEESSPPPKKLRG